MVSASFLVVSEDMLCLYCVYLVNGSDRFRQPGLFELAVVGFMQGGQVGYEPMTCLLTRRRAPALSQVVRLAAHSTRSSHVIQGLVQQEAAGPPAPHPSYPIQKQPNHHVSASSCPSRQPPTFLPNLCNQHSVALSAFSLALPQHPYHRPR